MRVSDDELTPDSVSIDEEALDKEWILQPRRYFKYATKLADAKKSLAEAKSRLEVVQAELEKDIRAEPENYGIDDESRITEKIVDRTIVLQPSYKDAKSELIESEYKVNLMSAMCDALEHKKKALENLVFLLGRNLMSTPHTDEETHFNLRRMPKRKKKRKPE